MEGGRHLPKAKASQAGHDRLLKDLLAIGFLTLGAFILAALIFSAQGYEGMLTRALARGLTLSLGIGAYGIPLVFFVMAAFYGLEDSPVAPTRALVGMGLLFGAVLTALHLRVPHGQEFYEAYLLAYGGYFGGALAWVFSVIVGPVGSYIILAGLAAAALILITQGTLPLFGRWVRSMAGHGFRAAAGGVDGLQERRRQRSGPRAPAAERPRRTRGPVIQLEPEPDEAQPESLPEPEPEPEPAPAPEPPPIPKAPDTDPLPGTPAAAPAPAGRTSGPSPLSLGKAKQATLPLADGEDIYQLPPITLLAEVKDEEETKEDRELAAENIIKLEDTLESFGIHAKVTHYERGPVLTRYEVEPERGIRVNQVSRHIDDLRMALAAWDVRVEAPIPGKSAVGIEVPNKKMMTVGLRNLVDCQEFRTHPSPLACCLGRDIAGHPVIADLVHMPHLLVAGATNSGKSVCLHSLITSLLMRVRPSEVQLIMVDPKRVELNLYEGIPHLMAPVVHTVQQAGDVLRKAIREMEKRYDQFAKVSAANIAEYNFFTAGARLAAGKKDISLETVMKKLKLDEAKARRLLDMMEWGGAVLPPNDDEDEVWRVVIDETDRRCVPLPRVVIVIDELADLMMQARAEFEFSICRIAQLARATGIHLVIATQRPSVKVVTGNIKANIPSRIALSVASQVDSRTILDGVGAERLIGRGDMLYAPIDASKPRRIQGAFVSRQEIEGVAEHWRRQGEPSYSIIPEVPEEENYSGDAEPTDELYADAVRFVCSEGEASVSMLQRRFKVGYARAGRLIDMMAQRGVVGPSQGPKPRQVLVGGAFVEGALGGSRPPLEDDEEGSLTSEFDHLPEPHFGGEDDEEEDEE
jgi:DNA segregation ATPase FtsK/SpoIIIE, S-DNA-T family